jgi:Na+-transporting methylmalonyl-CoA/oxaloacetate decarboxylase gamma subunit
MEENDGSTAFVKWTARIVAALGLGFVFVPIILGWSGELTSESVEFYVTGVGVPLLTFAGFLAVYLGFLSQREQNELQEEQLRKQQKNFQKDRFESTFFQLLRTHNQIVEDIHLPEKEYPHDVDLSNEMMRQLSDESPEVILISGRRCFEVFYSEFEELFEVRCARKVGLVGRLRE